MTAQQIAIDGPAAAGKSTSAKLVAKALGYLYIDTGAMYRAIALAALRAGIAFDDADSLTDLARRTDIRLESAGDTYKVFVNGEDVSEQIRRPEVGNAASPISAIEGVRQILVDKQRQMASSRPVVMDGRDIGTVVLPQAQCKVFLTAKPRIRAERRALELSQRGLAADIDEIEADIIERDHRDSNRAHSPLRQAEDAHLLDSSTMNIDQVVATIMQWAEAEQ